MLVEPQRSLQAPFIVVRETTEPPVEKPVLPAAMVCDVISYHLFCERTQGILVFSGHVYTAHTRAHLNKLLSRSSLLNCCSGFRILLHTLLKTLLLYKGYLQVAPSAHDVNTHFGIQKRVGFLLDLGTLMNSGFRL